MTADVGAYGNGSLVIGAMLCDRYRIDDFLGIGGMGVVVAATDTHAAPGSPGSRVALKLLRDELVAKGHIVERFLREARAVLRLSTEHVCRVFDIARLPTGAPIIVMEHLDGVDLARTTLRQALPSTIAVEYVMQACVALAEAHAKGVIHRDLKPANLFVIRRPDGGPMIKVLDFGIAKALFETDAALTRTRMMMGSPGYMSPEQIESAKDVDPRTDIWSLGVTLYQLLSMRLPFPGRNATEIALRVAADPPIPLDAEPAIAAIVMRCLAKRPEERYQDVGSLAHALAPYGGPSGRHVAAMVVEASRRGSSSVIAQVGPTSGRIGAQVGAPTSGQIGAQVGAPTSGQVGVQVGPTSGQASAQVGAPGSANVERGFVAPHAPTAGSAAAMPANASHASAVHAHVPNANANGFQEHGVSRASTSPAPARRRTALYLGIAAAGVIVSIVVMVAVSRGSNRRGGDSPGSAVAANESPGSNTPGSNGGPQRDRHPRPNNKPNHTDAPGSNGVAVDPWGPQAHKRGTNGADSENDDDDSSGDDSADLDSIDNAVNGAIDALDDRGAAETIDGTANGTSERGTSSSRGSVPATSGKTPTAGNSSTTPATTQPIDTSKLPNVPGMSKQQLQQAMQQAAVACKQLLDGKMPVAVPVEAQAACACMIRDAVRAQGLLDKLPDNKKPNLRRTCAQFGVPLK